MIERLVGHIVVSANQCVTCLTSSGIGFEIHVPDESVFGLHQEVTLYTYYGWSSDNGPTLYGFDTIACKQVFALLVSCSGIGPRMALASIKKLTPSDILSALITQNTSLLSSTPGIGVKKAEHMIVQLKDKAQQLIQQLDLGVSGNTARVWGEVAQVLETLGYSRQEISSAIGYVQKQQSAESQDELSRDVIVKKALLALAKNKKQ